MKLQLDGPLAALLTPRKPNGEVDHEGIERNVALCLSKGIAGFVVAGGTGEYADSSAQERKRAFERVRAAARDGAAIASVGAVRLAESVELAEHALANGADAILLPPPHFYRYSQDDLKAFYAEAARRIRGPVIIYNLAAFVTPLEPETIAGLIEAHVNIAGVKDSSGRLASLRLVSERRLDACRIIGHDRRLVQGLREGVVDAAISGPASVVPEALTALFDASGSTERLTELGALFDEFLDEHDQFPYPWFLKTIAQARGLFDADFPFPPPEETRVKLSRAAGWFEDWLGRWSRL